MYQHLDIKNPKRQTDELGFQSWFPYYAGFSTSFVESIINSASLDINACIADIWNGSGTTTTTARRLGYDSWGLDLNPVMLIAARAALLQSEDISCILPLTNDILSNCRRITKVLMPNDPLMLWFEGKGVKLIRNIQLSINKILVNGSEGSMLDVRKVETISSIAAFFYVALFRTVKLMIKPFTTSNPTWIKTPKTDADRINLREAIIKNVFVEQVKDMLASIEQLPKPYAKGHKVTLKLGSSCKISLQEPKADLIISSPPYCTRIDYAVATSPELAVLGYERRTTFNDLRKSLIGNSTVPVDIPSIKEDWGKACNNFLLDLYNHNSKASKTYYFKNHLQYFDSIYNSLIEIKSIMNPNAICVLVIQDSYYKDIHNDLPKIFIQMSQNIGLHLKRQDNFTSIRNMAGLQPQSRKYRKEFSATESVLCFTK